MAAFVAQGARVAFVDVNEPAAYALCERLSGAGDRLWFSRCDVSDTGALREVIAKAAAALGDISVLVNNAGNDQRQLTAAISEAEWQQSLATNLHPAFFASQAVQPMMARLGTGAIINMGSVVSYAPPSQLAAYVTAKAGLQGLTRALAREFGVDRIRVNCVLPGWVATAKQLSSWLTPAEEAELMKQQCLKQRLEERDIANMVLFLASADAAMVSAQEFVIDGGRV